MLGTAISLITISTELYHTTEHLVDCVGLFNEHDQVRTSSGDSTHLMSKIWWLFQAVPSTVLGHLLRSRTRLMAFPDLIYHTVRSKNILTHSPHPRIEPAPNADYRKKRVISLILSLQSL